MRAKCLFYTYSGGLCFHVASFEMQTVGWRGGKKGRGLREDESFVVLGFNELENTIALFWLWKLLWGHHKLAAGRYFNWQCFVWFLHMALYVSGGAFRGIQPKEREGFRDLSARTVNCFWSLEKSFRWDFPKWYTVEVLLNLMFCLYGDHVCYNYVPAAFRKLYL